MRPLAMCVREVEKAGACPACALVALVSDRTCASAPRPPSGRQQVLFVLALGGASLKRPQAQERTTLVEGRVSTHWGVCSGPNDMSCLRCRCVR